MSQSKLEADGKLVDRRSPSGCSGSDARGLGRRDRAGKLAAQV
jgi:hypothetical protein